MKMPVGSLFDTIIFLSSLLPYQLRSGLASGLFFVLFSPSRS